MQFVVFYLGGQAQYERGRPPSLTYVANDSNFASFA